MSAQALDEQRQGKAREYASKKRCLFFIELVLGAAFLLVLLLTGLSTGLRNALDFPQSARVALYFLIVIASFTIVSAPLGLYEGFILPRRYGISHQSLKSWLADEIKGRALALVLSMPLVVVIYLFLGKFPQTWWLLTFAFVMFVMVILTGIAPVLVLPLFYKTEPLADSELRKRLLKIAERSKVSIKGVFQAKFSSKTTAGNAMLMGWGNTRRLILSDTLLQCYSPDEIEVVMAHELGHHRHGDIIKLMLVQSSLILLGFYLVNLVLNWAVRRSDLLGVADVAAFPLLALVLAAFALVSMPLVNAYSRHIEERADEFSLTATANPQAFDTMLTKLTDQNLSESKPGRWAELLFYDHPPYYRRMEMARRYRAEGKQ